MFCDLALSKRLERAEGYASAQFAESRRRLFPDSRAEWFEHAGAYVVFDGVDSPVTQTFGLGIFEDLTATSLEVIERFFFERGAPVFHEVSPHAGVAAFDLLCTRNYRPIEISNVLYRSVEKPAAQLQSNINVRAIGPDDSGLFSDINARGWAMPGHPELVEFLLQFGTIATSREGTQCFLGEIDGTPAAAAALCIHQGVALFAGSATVPELRRRGLQSALLHERMRYASDLGCDLAMMVAAVGSESQRNAERKGFRVAYTRTKWHLPSPAQ
jgi:GNAT superfamily N-acetyltransferase